jgi:ketosteroid isomerase-like protein
MMRKVNAAFALGDSAALQVLLNQPAVTELSTPPLIATTMREGFSGTKLGIKFVILSASYLEYVSRALSQPEEQCRHPRESLFFPRKIAETL